MTIRVRPVDRGRSGRNPNRRTLYTNLAFGGTVIVSILILVIVGVTSWYGAHLAAAATVNGETITKDQFTERAGVEAFRLQQLAGRVTAELAAGRLTAAQAEARTTSINNQLDPQQFTPAVLEKLIDARIQAGLARELGIAITPEQIDQRILEDKTRKEERHVWLIAVKPEVDSGKTEPTDAQKAAAKKKADDALAAIKGGKAFEDVAKEISTDPSKASGGDYGWLDTDSIDDGEWEAALFKLEANGLTDVIVGKDDGIPRIGRVTEIVPAAVDPTWDQKLADANIKQETYRATIESEAIRAALNDRIVADASVSGPQRKVQELFIAAPAQAPATSSLKVRHILFSPKDDPQTAQTVPASDPEWSKAELAAKAAYEKIKKDAKQFDVIARAESDETSANGDDGTGGKLPYFDPASQIDEAFAAAIFKEGVKPGDLLEPFKSSFGWHVVQVMYGPPDSAQMEKLRTQAATPGTDFGQLVRDFSDGPKAGKGGDIGWVAKGQLDDRLTSVILATPAGSLTSVIDIPNDGLYLFKVNEERTAAPDEEQLKTIKSDAFRLWYAGKKAAVKITRELIDS